MAKIVSGSGFNCFFCGERKDSKSISIKQSLICLECGNEIGSLLLGETVTVLAAEAKAAKVNAFQVGEHLAEVTTQRNNLQLEIEALKESLTSDKKPTADGQIPTPHDAGIASEPVVEGEAA